MNETTITQGEDRFGLRYQLAILHIGVENHVRESSQALATDKGNSEKLKQLH